MNNVLEISSISLGIEHVCSPSLEAAALCSLIIFKGPSSILIPTPPPHKLSSADLALLIYTPLNLGEVAEPSLKGAPEEKQRFTPVGAGCGLLFHFLRLFLTLPAVSINLQAVSGKLAGGWQGMLCCPAPLILHPLHGGGFLRGGGALCGCAAVPSSTFSLL